jgi:hypothetical protein
VHGTLRATLFAIGSQCKLVRFSSVMCPTQNVSDYNAVKLCCSKCQVTRSLCPLKACQCNSRFYCVRYSTIGMSLAYMPQSTTCQKTDWHLHKVYCKPYTEHNPSWSKWYPTRRVFWQAIMSREFITNPGSHMRTDSHLQMLQ